MLMVQVEGACQMDTIIGEVAKSIELLQTKKILVTTTILSNVGV
jgi:hypothetical protein